MQKGQIQQVFVYIITIILIGLVMLVGYKSIGGLMKKGCDVEMSTFKNTLGLYIEKHSDYGSSHKELIKVPCDFNEICFVDSDAVATGQTSLINDPDYDVIESSVASSIKQNVFLVKTEVTEPVGYYEEIVVNLDNPYPTTMPSFPAGSYFFCVERANGKFPILFEGQGKTIKISPAD